MSDELDWVLRLRPDVDPTSEPGLEVRILAAQRRKLMASISGANPPVANPPAGTPQIIPNLPYRDIGAALEWLERAFGFSEIEAARVEDDAANIGHAEMELGAGRIMLGSPGGHGAFPPKDSGSPSQLLSVYVDEIDTHCERARAAGGFICAELEDKFYGDRVYEVLDLEGHRWSFHQHTGKTFPIGGSPDEGV